MDNYTQQLEQENEVLRERVRQLEEELAPDTVTIDPVWRLTRHEARIFAALAARDVLTKNALMIALYPDRLDADLPEIKIIDVFVCKMRKKLAPFHIEISTVWGQGYSLLNRSLWIRQKAFQ